jgi:cysteine desulfurase
MLDNKTIIYMDHNATTPVDKEVLSVMLPYLTDAKFFNPSSVYYPAQAVREDLEQARATVARLLNAQKHQIIFTGGGSESDNLAIKGVANSYTNKGKHIITSKIEHSAVLKTCEELERNGFEVTYLGVDAHGFISLDELKNAIRKDTILISIMHANNETGIIQPIKDIGKIAKEHKVLFHTDAVQTAGKMHLDVNELNVDLLSLSAHKFYGPKGVGALYIRGGVKLKPLIDGGEQELKLRAGTENVAGIIGLAKAMDLSIATCVEEWKREKELKDYLQELIIQNIPDIKVNGNHDQRLANTLNVSIEYIEGEALLFGLSDENLLISSGSACTSGSLEPSHVLLAMGLSHELAHGSLRFSLGKSNTREQIEKTVVILSRVVEKLRAFSPFGRNKASFNDVPMENNKCYH